MTYAHANIPAAELALIASDAPFIVARNAARLAEFAAWSNGTGIVGDTDWGEVGYETFRLHDLTAHRRSRPSTSDTEWYIVFQLPEDETVDTIALINTNFSEITDLEIRIDGANNTTFSSGVEILYEGSLLTDGPHVFAALNVYTGGEATAQRFTNLEFVRIYITTTGGVDQIIPEIGEVWIGRRWTLPHPRKANHDHLGYTGQLRVTGPGGASDVSEDLGYVAARVFDYEALERDGDSLRGIRDDSGLVRPVLVVPQGTSGVNEAYLAYFDDYVLPVQTVADPALYRGAFRLTETAPLLAGL